MNFTPQLTPPALGAIEAGVDGQALRFHAQCERG
jgi:hypothetical protein